MRVREKDIVTLKTMETEFRKIEGFDYYSVSKEGLVRNDRKGTYLTVYKGRVHLSENGRVSNIKLKEAMRVWETRVNYTQDTMTIREKKHNIIANIKNNPEFIKIMYEQKACYSPYYMTQYEAESVESLGGCFEGTTIKDLTPLKYFKYVKAIGDFEFRGCYYLEKIELPETLNRMGRYTFDECFRLEKLEIPEGVGIISYSCINRCWALKELILPKYLGYIGDYGINSCGELEVIKFNSDMPPQIGRNSFNILNDSFKVIVPKNTKELYQKITNLRNIYETD